MSGLVFGGMKVKALDPDLPRAHVKDVNQIFFFVGMRRGDSVKCKQHQRRQCPQFGQALVR